MDVVVNLLPHVINGLALGLLFSLIALGFMLIVSVMEVINLAHGSLFALGAYVALLVLGNAATPATYALALVIAPLAVAGFGLTIELCMRRTYGRDPLYGLLLTFGAALVIEEMIRAFWGSRERMLPLPAAISGAVLIGDLIYAKYRFFACGMAAALIGLLWLFIEKTQVGAVIKAGAHDS